MAEVITEDDVTAAIALGDPDFAKYVAEQIAAGTAPKKDAAAPATPAAKKEEGTPAAKKEAGKNSTFFAKNEPEFKGIDSKEKFDAVAKEKFGIDTTAGYDTLLTSAQKWREGAQKAADAENKLKSIEKSIKSLPPVLKVGMQAFTNAQDWKKTILENLSKLDYNVPVDNYRKEELASHYFTTKVADAKAKLENKKIDQDAYETLIDTFHTAAVSKFNAEKSEFDASRKLIIDQQAEDQKNVNKSVDTTLANLKQKFADFDDNKLTEVKSHLEGNLLALFLNEDGTVREDAGVKLALALFGEEEISSRVGVAIKDAKTDTTLGIIDGADKTPKIPAGGGAPRIEDIDSTTKVLFEQITGGNKKEY